MTPVKEDCPCLRVVEGKCGATDWTKITMLEDAPGMRAFVSEMGLGEYHVHTSRKWLCAPWWVWNIGYLLEWDDAPVGRLAVAVGNLDRGGRDAAAWLLSNLADKTYHTLSVLTDDAVTEWIGLLGQLGSVK